LCRLTTQATKDTTGAQGFAASPVGTPRVWTYTYNSTGQLLTADGPRTDVEGVTTYTYYADDHPNRGKRGNLTTITNALGHTTRITQYDAHGNPRKMVDPNGLVTLLTYDTRQRLISRRVGTEDTSMTMMLPANSKK
jgi:YD repeat-containing protein